MSKILVFWLLTYFGGLFYALRHPIFPLVSYLAFYYMPPHDNWWGRYLPDLRFSLMAASVLTASVVLHRGSLERVHDDRNPARPWLLLMGLNTLLVTAAWSLNLTRSWFWSSTFIKLVLIYMLIPAAVRTPAQFDVFGAFHVAGASYWGWKAWDNPKRSAGRLENVGGPDTQSDNLAAAHLLTVLPFAALFMLTAKNKAARLAAAVAGAFILNVFILCNSRGATLGLISSGLAAILLVGKFRRKKLIGVAFAGAFAVLLLADPEFIARQQTTANPQDGSALNRLVMWQAGYEMVKDYPLGGGGRTFHILSPKYIPQILEEADIEERSSHNTYVQLATDWGIQGMTLWLGFILMSCRMLHRIRKRMPQNDWYVYRSLAVEIGLIGTLTAAFFSNRLYGESIYWLCALAFALHRIQSTELAADATSSVTVPDEGPPHPVRAVARRAEALAR